jgi:uncharacterized membrane protein
MKFFNSDQKPGDGLERFADGLGWFSIGLGLAEICAPHVLSRLIGVKNRPLLFASLGAREVLSGVGILSQPRPAGWLWSRVAGDVMDLSLLGAAFTDDDNDEERIEFAGAAVAGVMVLDVIAAIQHSRSEAARSRGITVEKSIAIDRSPEELYKFWRDFHNLPRFMRHLQSVRVVGGNRSHWVAKGPAGAKVEWDAEIVTERPNELIAWRSLPGADVENAGSVVFERAPGNRGTYVRVQLEYNPPAGRIGAAIARMFGESPGRQVQSDLYRFKQVMETGQITTTEGQSTGRPSSTSKMYDTDNTRS